MIANISTISRRENKTGFYLIAFAVLLSIRFWSFTVIPDGVYDGLEFIMNIILAFIIINNWHKIRNRKMMFRNNVMIFLFVIPVISMVAAYIYHGQSFLYSALTLRRLLFWQFYFVLHIFNIQFKSIVKLCTVIALVWAFLTIIQQFTYPWYYFASRTEDSGSEILRAGVYRFMLFRHHYAILISLYFLYIYFKKREIKYLLMFMVILVGFYYFGTRQFAISLIVCCVLMGVLGSGDLGTRFVAILVLCLIGFVLYSFRYQIFGQFIQLTESDVGNEDYIRFLSADFFLKRNWPPGILPRILGNGAAHSVTRYGAEVLMIQERFRFFASDVGMIGAYNTFGLVYVLNVLSISIKGLRYKLYEKTRMWVPFVFFSSVMLLFISEYFSNASTIPFFCILFYIADLSFKRPKQLQDSVSSDYAKLPRL